MKQEITIIKAFVFDFDDTLATTECQVRVVCKTTKTVITKLTPAEFNNHSINDNHEYDFSEFGNPEFIENANAMEMMALAQEVHQEQHAVYILTARANNVASAIANFLLKHGIKPVEVYGVGSEDKKVNIADEKKKVLQQLAEEFTKVYFYDDCEENCELAKNASDNIKVYLV